MSKFKVGDKIKCADETAIIVALPRNDESLFDQYYSVVFDIDGEKGLIEEHEMELSIQYINENKLKAVLEIK